MGTAGLVHRFAEQEADIPDMERRGRDGVTDLTLSQEVMLALAFRHSESHRNIISYTFPLACREVIHNES